jgi:Tfp pilus assembly protein PilO
LIFGGGIAIFVVVAIIPAQNTAKNLGQQIADIKMRIEEQKILNPVYKSLKKQSKINPPQGIAMPQREKLVRGDTQKISSDFRQIASDSKLTLKEYRPDVNTILEDTEYLMINVLVEGEFFDLQNFLIQLCQLPYLELVEEINIKPVKDTKQFRLQIWMVQQ